MTRSDVVFGRSLESVTFADVERLIIKNKTVESNALEYKSGFDKFGEYAEDIVAFLNVDGGILILGTPKEAYLDPHNKAKGKVCTGPFRYHPYCAKDWLRNQLLGAIEPLPLGVRIHTVKDGDDDKKCVSIVEVEKSENPPHQTKGTYYIRLDGETRRAPHGIVEALFQRRRRPVLELVPEFIPKEPTSLYLVVRNRGTGVAKSMSIVVRVPKDLRASRYGPNGSGPRRMVLLTPHNVSLGLFRFDAAAGEVVHPYSELRIGQLFGPEDFTSVIPGDYAFDYVVFAEDMKAVRGRCVITVTDEAMRIVSQDVVSEDDSHILAFMSTLT